MADLDVFCNIKKCRKRLTNVAWVTSCSHAFCEDDASQTFLTKQDDFTCPACNTKLPEKHDIVKVNINPSEKFKSMVLAGLRPEIIMDITNRALTFWHFQMYQELQYQKALVKRSSDNLCLAEESYTDQIMKMKAELQLAKRNQDDLKQEMENQAHHMEELHQRIVEKNRQLQNLMATNNKLRCNTTLPGEEYGMVHSPRNKYCLGPQTLNDMFPSAEDAQFPNVCGQDFVFNPVIPSDM